MRTASAPAVRSATTADLDRIVCIQESAPEASQWSIEWYREKLVEPESRYSILVAVLQGQIAAFTVTLDAAGEMELLNLAVAPECRRQGLGTMLISTVAARGGAVHLEVREKNEPAVRFYKHLGFRVAGRRTSYYRAPPRQRLSDEINPLTPTY